jgi:hypothetical protein
VNVNVAGMENYSPARKARPSRSKNLRGKITSLKMGGVPYCYESSLERDAMYLLEFDRSVKAYYPQPFSIDYVIGKRQYKYTPDLLVVKHDGENEVWEVKPDSKLIDPKVQVKWSVLKQHCELSRKKARMVTDKDIRKDYLIDNVMFLKHYGRYSGNAKPLVENVLSLLELKTCLTINDVLAQLTDYQKNDILKCVYYMLYEQIISMEHKERISLNTKIFINKESLNA